jgi:hypothetical protein
MSTFDEVAYSIVRLRMISFERRHMVSAASGQFTTQDNQVMWMNDTPVTAKIVKEVADAIKE